MRRDKGFPHCESRLGGVWTSPIAVVKNILSAHFILCQREFVAILVFFCFVKLEILFRFLYRI